ncbi:conserved hypothetical protein [Alteromonas sp. 38]|nr:conserved hypothetical protein [Alteromonas sp. 154]VXB81421.1 conserved hypothetical protein [Alteromonas sp. 38]
MWMVAEACILMHRHKRMRLAGVVLALGLLQGCFGAPSINDTMDEYTTRLSRVLESPLAEAALPDASLPNSAPADETLESEAHSTLQLNATLALPSQTYPSLTALGNKVTALNINIREFYAIQDCELGRIVAERNTALGKTQLPSQRLQYEHQLLNALAKCETTLKEAQNPTAATVAEWRKQKRSQYMNVWANVVQTSSEMKLGLSMASSPLQANGNKDAKASVSALNFINGLAKTAQSQGVVEDELEQQLQIIASSRLPAKLWQTQAILNNRLALLNQVLAPALNDVKCENGTNSDKATILRNVFYLYFIEEIQPIASTLNSYHYQLQSLWEQWGESTALSVPFKAHIRTHAVDNFTQYSATMKAHVTLWQNFLGRCNLSPTAP